VRKLFTLEAALLPTLDIDPQDAQRREHEHASQDVD